MVVDDHVDAFEVHRALDFVGVAAQDNGQASDARLTKCGKVGFDKRAPAVGEQGFLCPHAGGLTGSQDQACDH